MATPPVRQSEISNGHSSAGTGPIRTAVAAHRRRNPVSDDFALCIEWDGQCRNTDMRPLPNPKIFAIDPNRRPGAAETELRQTGPDRANPLLSGSSRRFALRMIAAQP